MNESQGTTNQKARILLVDDRPENLLALTAILNDPGYILVQSTSAEGALKSLMHNEFALLLLDVMMPDMDGFALAEIIRQNPRFRSTPIIFLTAVARDIEYVYKGYSVGAVDYLTKPLQPDIVRAKVSVFAELYRKTVQIRVQEEQLRKREKLEQELYVAKMQHNSDIRYRALADAIPQLVWTAGPDGLFTFMNKRWWEYCRLSLESGSSWDSFVSLIHPDDRASFLEHWQSAFINELTFEAQCRFAMADQSTFRWFLCRALCERNANDQVVGWLGTCTDIEDQKRAENEQMQASRMKDEFLSMISHELRTPLNGIIGWVDLLLLMATGEKVQHGLNVIGRNGKALAKLVDDVLDVSQIVSGKFQIFQQVMDFKPLVQSVVEVFQPLAEAKGVHFMAKLQAQHNMILGDAARLRQVVWHLLANAIKFTPQEGRVVVTLEEERGQTILKVEDNGVGVEAEFLPHVFERFRQQDSSSTRSFGGLGLGLTIVRHIVQLHGGAIEVFSAGKDRGTVSTLKFMPAPGSTQSPKAEGKRATEARQIAQSSLNGVRILFVDDEPDNRAILAEVLELEGAVVSTVSSAREALLALRQGLPDVLISDLRLPVEDGYSLMRAIRKWLKVSGNELPCIALTAFASSEDKARVLAAGFTMHVSKPVTTKELIQAVATLTAARKTL